MSTLALTGVHAKYQLIETFRVPMAVIGSVIFPTLAFCFFVLPQTFVTSDSRYSIEAIVSMTVFAFMANGLFSFGLDLATQREKPWVPYLRTLPGSSVARMLGLIAGTMVMAIIAMIPVLVVGAIFTAARPAPLDALAAIGLVILTAVPSAMVGMIIGSTLSSKVAIAVTQLVMFGLAFLSGLFLPPMMFPDWLDLVSRFSFVRQAREIVIAAAVGEAIPLWAILGILAWTVALGVLAVVVMRRSEGRRFA